MKNHSYRTFLLTLAIFVLSGCFSSLSNNQDNRSQPDKTVDLFIDALNKKNGELVYKLILPSNRTAVEDNIKTYLNTIIELTGEEKVAQKILSLYGQEFFEKFLSSKYSARDNKKVEYVIAEVKMLNHNTAADVKLLINGASNTVKLNKQGKVWYINADNLLVS